ncbi:protein-methionine-sulfoxide reductase heme-binding subunit MsrQ [Vibrio sp. SCSIO 43136]|uniref:protein-methionine-sulfoxide reductase heme-binding subunit MsrQ n=1 Tax=Vibrio sp. SCSIO 43136 TaxID=2819101 RepID=UPI0020762BE3|nr:protein-methionine-sulfoxide reductase heme-binding subunit MsrQ [Vibrio sp. SCSIO 43136]USD66755.1 protein-methionine-sulfoxide reductase heme-binding subunit MsrQ [Vibrio sp. SCSIO 43136]
MVTARHKVLATKILIHLAQWTAFAWLALNVINQSLGAEPVDVVVHFFGKAALNTLLLTLVMTPFVRRFKTGWLIQCRRLMGLYSFAWAMLHLTAYLALDLDLRFDLLIEEVFTRPYLIVGAISWVILLLLTLTSTQSMMRKLGKTWQALHNWVYLAALLAPIHYLWSVKSGIIEPAIYLLVTLAILSTRKQKFMRWLATYKKAT